MNSNLQSGGNPGYGSDNVGRHKVNNVGDCTASQGSEGLGAVGFEVSKPLISAEFECGSANIFYG
jgi:hypothetical protein